MEHTNSYENLVRAPLSQPSPGTRELPSGLGFHPPDRLVGEFGRIPQPQLLLDVGAVGVDRADAHPSSPAISRELFPSPIARKTSSSRSVEPRNGRTPVSFLKGPPSSGKSSPNSGKSPVENPAHRGDELVRSEVLLR